MSNSVMNVYDELRSVL